MRFYGRLEDLLQDKSQNIVVVDDEGNLLGLKNAIQLGLRRVTKEGEIPFIPLTTNDYKGNIYLGQDQCLEFSPNEYTLEEARELWEEGQYDQLQALQEYYKIKHTSSSPQELLNGLINFIQDTSDTTSLTYQLFQREMVKLVYEGLESNNYELLDKEFLTQLCDILSSVNDEFTITLNGYTLPIDTVANEIGEVLALTSHNAWFTFLESKITDQSPDQPHAIITSKLLLRTLSHQLLQDTRAKDLEIQQLQKLLELRETLDRRQADGHQMYSDISVFAAIYLHCLGEVQQAKSILDEVLTKWEDLVREADEYEIIKEKTLDRINETIVNGTPLTTYSYRLIVLIWRRIALTDTISTGKASFRSTSYSDFSDYPYRKIALRDNETILNKERYSPILGALIANRQESMLTELLQYLTNEDLSYRYRDSFGYSVQEYHENRYQSSIQMLERRVELTQDNPVDEFLRNLFIAYIYLRWVREKESKNAEVGEIETKFQAYIETLNDQVNTFNIAELAVLEYMPVRLDFPFATGGFAGAISVLDRLNKEITTRIGRSSLVDTRISTFLTMYQASPLYMKYIHTMDHIELVIEFQEMVSALSEAYWSRNYTKAEKIYDQMHELQHLDWKKLSQARGQYIDDTYPSDLRQQGMVVDLSQYYNERAMYNWGQIINYIEAIRLFDISAKSSSHPLDKSRASMNIGTLYLHLSDFDNCLKYYNRSIVYVDDYRYLNDKVTIIYNTALLEYYKRRYDLAQSKLKEAINLAQEILSKLDEKTRDLTETNNHPFWLRRLEFLIFTAQGKIDEAIFSLEEQFDFALKIGPKALLNIRYNYIGLIVNSLIILKGGKLLVENQKQKERIKDDITKYLEIQNDVATKKLNPETQIQAQSAELLVQYYQGSVISEDNVKKLYDYVKTSETEALVTIPSLYILSLLMTKMKLPLVKEFITYGLNLPKERTSYSQRILFYLLKALVSPTVTETKAAISDAKTLALTFEDKRREMIIVDFEEKIVDYLEMQTWDPNNLPLQSIWQKLVMKELNGMLYFADILENSISER